MFAFVLIPLAAFWAGDNHDFLAKVSAAPWHYVGVQERAIGRQPDGAVALPLEMDGHSYILFKQLPVAAEDVAARTPTEIEQASVR